MNLTRRKIFKAKSALVSNRRKKGGGEGSRQFPCQCSLIEANIYCAGLAINQTYNRVLLMRYFSFHISVSFRPSVKNQLMFTACTYTHPRICAFVCSLSLKRGHLFTIAHQQRLLFKTYLSLPLPLSLSLSLSHSHTLSLSTVFTTSTLAGHSVVKQFRRSFFKRGPVQ